MVFRICVSWPIRQLCCFNWTMYTMQTCFWPSVASKAVAVNSEHWLLYAGTQKTTTPKKGHAFETQGQSETTHFGMWHVPSGRWRFKLRSLRGQRMEWFGSCGPIDWVTRQRGNHTLNLLVEMMMMMTTICFRGTAWLLRRISSEKSMCCFQHVSFALLGSFDRIKEWVGEWSPNQKGMVFLLFYWHFVMLLWFYWHFIGTLLTWLGTTPALWCPTGSFETSGQPHGVAWNTWRW